MPVSVTPVKSERIERLYAGTRNPGDKARFGALGTFLPALYEASAQEVKDFEVHDDDVWVVTPPKCGTTWTQEMVWLLINNLDYEGAKQKTLNERCPFVELSRFAGEDELMEGIDTLKITANLKQPRCIKTHLPKDLLPDQLWTKKTKIVYVAREPKDVAVSYYHHYKLLNNYQGDRQLFFESFLEDTVFHSPIWEHILEFWKMKDESHILFLTYEEMKKDISAVIRKMASFLGKLVTEEQVKELAEHLDIKKMRENPSVNINDLLQKLQEDGLIKENQKFIRKGETGEGRKEIPPEMAAKYDERTRKVFANAPGGSPWKV